MCKCLLLCLAIIFPPLAVLANSGCTVDLCINLLLTLLGFIPGIMHAIYVIFYYQPRGSALPRQVPMQRY